eukprot:1343041-Ditylum_brightwellii.AAC.1
MRHATEVLDNIHDKIPERYKILFSAFPDPRVLITSCVQVQYAKSLVSDVEILDNKSKYDMPPMNAVELIRS